MAKRYLFVVRVFVGRQTRRRVRARETISTMAHSLLQRAEHRIELEANVPYEYSRRI